MLSIYFVDDKSDKNIIKTFDKQNIIRDAEAAFTLLNCTFDDTDFACVKAIENSELHQGYFVDRFGCPHPLLDLSTGAKAAIVVNHNPDKIVDLIECGFNARDAIIHYINKGTVITWFSSITVADIDVNKPTDIDVCVHGKYRIETVERLNYWLCYDCDYSEPDWDIEGISEVSRNV